MALIQIKRSTGTATPPSLAEGELAYSELSDNLFIGKSGSVVAKIGGLTEVNKLAGVEALADVTDTANVTAAGALMDSELASESAVKATTAAFLTADETKLDGIETAATADQTGAEIKTAYEAEANAFTDAQFTKLGGIETSADVTDTANVDAAGAVMHTDVSGGNDGFLLKTGAETYESVKLNRGAAAAPIATDDTNSGYSVGSRWIDTTNNEEWLCVDATATSAVWLMVSGGGDVDGPGVAVDNAVTRFDGTDGKNVQSSGVVIDDSDNVTGIANLSLTGTVDGRDVDADGTAQDDHIADVSGNPHAVTLEQARSENGTLAGNIAMGGFKVTGAGNGTAAGDLVNKSQLDAAQAGILVKDGCRVATDAALPAVTAAGASVGKTLTADAVGILTVDGVATLLGDRVLVKDQVAQIDNGIYEVTTEGTAGVAFILTRATDYDGDPASEITEGTFTFISEGTANQKSGWVLLDDADFTAGVANVDVASNELVFAQFQGLPAYVEGSGIDITGDTISMDITNLTTAAVVAADELAFYDISLGAIRKTTVSLLLGAISGLSNVLNDADIFVGNGSNIATGVTMSGDATMANDGTITLTAAALDGGSF